MQQSHMQQPAIATALNHVAYPTTHTAATVRFYTEVLGFRLVDAIRGTTDPDSGKPRPFLHTFFAMGSGEIIAFFEVEGLEVPADERVPRWVRHLALSVDSPATLAAWKARLETHGLSVIGPIDHEGTWASIYFVDPNGVTLELTHQSRALDDEDARRAAEVVARWAAEHSRAA
jgi:catechol 2,3-dioxygenase-like lactoylglutathione lyase family enzyme